MNGKFETVREHIDQTKKRIMKVVRYLSLAATSILLMTLSKIVPNRDGLWVFRGPTNLFKDNSKYLYLYISEEVKGDSAVWITDSKEDKVRIEDLGYNSYLENSLTGIYYVLRAKYLVTSSSLKTSKFAAKNSTTVQLWHGIPFKKMGHNEFPYDVLCTHSKFDEDLLEPLIKTKKIHHTGYPRNDVFLSDRDYMKNTIINNEVRMVSNHKNSRIIGYFPTYRSFKEEFKPFKLRLLNEYLAEDDSILLVKPHRYMDIGDMSNFSNITVLDSRRDIYPIFEHIDVMITDYSSIFFDYLLVDKPIIFYTYDYDEYKKHRGFALNYEDYTPGPKATNTEELINTLQMVKKNDGYANDRENISKKVFKYTDGNSSKRAYKALSN